MTDTGAPSPGTALPPLLHLRNLLWGHMVTQAIGVAAQLGVADALAERPLPCAEIAMRVGANERALYRVLRALASMNIFEETEEPHVFTNTALSNLLRTDAQPSLRHLAILNSGSIFKAWGHALSSVKSGEPAFAEAFGSPYFQYLGEHPDESAVFNAAMSGPLLQQSRLLAAQDWAGVRTVVDMGGGDGTLLLRLLAAAPGLQGTVFDLPQVEEAARAKIATAGLDARCSYEAGSFLDKAPAADCYLFARALHNWNDASAKTILGHCRDAILPGGKLLILEEVLDDGNAPHPGKILDLQMLVIPGGGERTRREWEALLDETGFVITKIDPTGLVQAEARA